MPALFGRRASKASRAGPLRDAIEATELAPILQKAMQRNGWTVSQSHEAAVHYRRFLYLLAAHPREMITPWSADLDLLWHEHILDTRRYGEDCRRIFGRFIHHDPHVADDPDRTELARRRTDEVFRSEFLPWSRRGADWLTGVYAGVNPRKTLKAFPYQLNEDGGGEGGCAASSCGSSCGSD
jgi:hypothetical protein